MSVYGPVEDMSELLTEQIGGNEWTCRVGFDRAHEFLEDELFFVQESARRQLDECGLQLQKQEALGAYLETTTTDGQDRIRLERRRLYVCFELGNRRELVAATSALVKGIHERYGSGRVWALGELPHVIDDDGVRAMLLSNGEGAPRPHVVLRAFYCHEGMASK